MNNTKDLVRIEDVVKRFGRIDAVDHVDLSIHEGEFFALLGPSGCGKTTLLRILAGFEMPDSGRILLDGIDLVGIKPWKRPVNMMFQTYALFPHMSVYDNVAYGLRQDKINKADIERRAIEVLRMVGLAEFSQRKPETLSGGQKQRVALARAIVKQPRVLLLDEPLAALDRKLRVEMRLELKRLQHELGIAFIFVTHDQEEALTMSDRAAIMNSGRVLQVGTPEELYEAPTSLFVADFIGESNVFIGVIEMGGKEVTVKQGDIVLRVSPEATERVGLSDGDSVAIVVRPEHIQIRSAGAEMFEYERMNFYKGRIVEVVYLGSTRNYIINLDNDTRVLAQAQAGEDSKGVAEGDQVFVGWEIKRGVLVPNAEQTLDEITTTHI